MNPAVTDEQRAATTPMPPIGNPIQGDKMERNKMALSYLGITEIILGVISGVLGGMTFGVILGIWGGLLLLISGILGVTARCHPTKPVYTANLVLSILAVVAMVIMLFISSIVAAAARDYSYHGTSIVMVLCIISAVMGFAAVIITSIHCSYSCVVNSTKRRRDGRVMYRSVPQQQLVPTQLPNGQIVYYPSQTIPSASLYPSNVPAPMVTGPMAFPNANQPIHPAQLVYPTTTQDGLTGSAISPTYNIPMAYYPPTVPTSLPVYSSSLQGGTTPNYQPGFVMPNSAVPKATSSQQASVALDIQQSPSSHLAETSDNPRLYGDRNQTK